VVAQLRPGYTGPTIVLSVDVNTAEPEQSSEWKYSFSRVCGESVQPSDQVVRTKHGSDSGVLAETSSKRASVPALQLACAILCASPS
jgi:hypothetical protein